MTPTVILLILAAVAIAGVVWYVRRKPARPFEEQSEQDTAWNDPIDPIDPGPIDPERRP